MLLKHLFVCFVLLVVLLFYGFFCCCFFVGFCCGFFGGLCFLVVVLGDFSEGRGLLVCSLGVFFVFFCLIM